LNKVLKIILSFLILLPLSSCDLDDLKKLKGEKVWVFVDLSDEGELLKVNSVTRTDNNGNLHIKSIMDVYDKNGSYKHTYIFHMVDSEKKDRINKTIKTGPLTLLTDNIEKGILRLSDSDEKHVKQYVLSKIREIKYK
jgi:hypothetical protein